MSQAEPSLAPPELVGLECSGCRTVVSLLRRPGTGIVSRSSRVGELHDGCPAKGTWRAQWRQLSLFGEDGHG
jgi:hypothetical protein